MRAKNVQIGWYLSSDNTLSIVPIEGKKVIGVVAKIETSTDGIPKIFSLSVNEAQLPWNEGLGFVTGATDVEDGTTNSHKLLSTFGKSSMPAAKWCEEYGGFLPAPQQLLIPEENLEVVNEALRSIDKPQLHLDRPYWTSAEHDESQAQCVYLDRQQTYAVGKNAQYYIRAMFQN